MPENEAAGMHHRVAGRNSYFFHKYRGIGNLNRTESNSSAETPQQTFEDGKIEI
jgi:hypothetical protein